MRYLRMLTNAIAGGVLVAMYLVVLVLQLNPHVSVASETAARWFVALLSMYGPFLSVSIYFLLVARELLGSRSLQPAWLSVRLLAWLGAAGAAGAAAITWANLDGFRAVLTAEAAERMRQGAVATTASAVILFSIALLRYSFGRRGSRATGVLLTATMILSVVVPLVIRGPGESPVPSARRPRATTPQAVFSLRVRMVLLDGASLGFIRQRVAIGQLPNLGRLLDLGASMDLASLRPTQAETVWAAAATGKYPPKNGVRSDAVYRVLASEVSPVDLLPDYCFAYALVEQNFVRRTDVTAAALDARPLWDILADYGLASGIVAWPLTFPARAERGYIVSDHFDDAAGQPLRSLESSAADPTSAVAAARRAFREWLTRSWHDILPAASPQEPTPDASLPARWDQAYIDAATELETQFAPRLTAVRFAGLAAFGHVYLRQALPDRFGDVRRELPQPSVLDRYYATVDRHIGREIGRLGPGDLLLVVSGFGIEPTPLARRLLARALGQPEVTGTHEAAPDGFVLAYGTNVANGHLARGAIVDIAPTVLYYMGLRVGRDMDGFARTDLFTPAFTRDRPVGYIQTHER